MKSGNVPTNPGRILVINLPRIGDTLLNTPVIRALRQAFPGARLTVLAHRRRLAVLENNPDIDVLLADNWWRRWLTRLSSRRSYDLVVVAPPCRDPRVFRYARRVGRFVVGFEQSDPTVNEFLDRRALGDPVPGRTHAVVQRLRLAAAVGAKDLGTGLVYCIRPGEERWAATYLSQLGIPPKSITIGLQVAGFPSKAYRDWPAGHFLALGEAALAKWPAHLLLFGGPGDRDKAGRIQAALGERAVSLAGLTTLRQSAALLARCRAFVTTDTGMMHLAFALEVPTVALFHCMHTAAGLGPSSRPEIHRVVQMQPPPGEPCTRQLTMVSVTPELIFERLRELLEGPGSP